MSDCQPNHLAQFIPQAMPHVRAPIVAHVQVAMGCLNCARRSLDLAGFAPELMTPALSPGAPVHSGNGSDRPSAAAAARGPRTGRAVSCHSYAAAPLCSLTSHTPLIGVISLPVCIARSDCSRYCLTAVCKYCE